MRKKILQHQLKELFADLKSPVVSPQGAATDQGERPPATRSQPGRGMSARKRSTASTITIKGQRDGLLVILDEAQDWAIQMAELETALENNKSFFTGARLAIQTGKRLLPLGDIQTLQSQLAQREITLWAIFSESAATRATARHLNLTVEFNTVQELPAQPKPDASRIPLPEVDERGWLVRRTLRSGQKAHYTGHVSIIGDVNPGAEVVAGGDIIVWGRLQGLVHAGAMGDNGAVICALVLSPTQLRIGSHIARSPEEKRRRKVQPEMVSVVEGQIVAEPWDSRKRRKK